MNKRRFISIQLAAIVLMLSACAVHNNPEITPGTARDLSIVYQLTQANKDYVTFFTDVGDAKRQGLLTDVQVGQLNVLGNSLKTILEEANATWKTYQSSRDNTKLEKTAAYLLQVTSLFTRLLTARTQMLIGGK